MSSGTIVLVSDFDVVNVPNVSEPLLSIARVVLVKLVCDRGSISSVIPSMNELLIILLMICFGAAIFVSIY